MWQQTEITLSPRSRGFHIITREIDQALQHMPYCTVGLLHLFLKHSSASLSINENADPTVRSDMEAHFNQCVPERAPYYQHTYEGDDDMPAHIKSSTLGCELTIPIKNGQLQLGTWQGIYFGEHRNHGGSRKIVMTLNGDIGI